MNSIISPVCILMIWQVLHVSDLDQPALPENGYKTMIHREANNSFLVSPDISI